ncbi:MAG: hypothetical protein ACRD36_01955, partial [Candidatus Acidiferrum sp.]
PPPPDPVNELPPPSHGGSLGGTAVSSYTNQAIPPEPVSRTAGRQDDNYGVRQTGIIPQPVPLDGERGGIALASNRRQDLSSSVAPYGMPPSVGRGALPPVEVINSRQAKLDFQVGKYGPSGLGNVEVYITTDDGSTWTQMPTEHNVSLPSSADIRSGAPVRGSVMVELKQEGVVHGFYIVVKSRAGLGKEPPRQGTMPQLRIELDTTVPVATLYEPKPDPGRRDTLLLGWDASDKNLAANPVSLEWSEQRDGPWNAIGPNALPNTGKFSWQVPANVPPAVYLRLTVRDTAGNVAVAKTNEPVLVDLSIPEVGAITLNRSH